MNEKKYIIEKRKKIKKSKKKYFFILEKLYKFDIVDHIAHWLIK